MNNKRKPLFDDTILHRLWTKAVGTPDYDKEEWMELEKLVHTGIITQLNKMTKCYRVDTEEPELRSYFSSKYVKCSKLEDIFTHVLSGKDCAKVVIEHIFEQEFDTAPEEKKVIVNQDLVPREEWIESGK